MKRDSWQVKIGITLVCVSILLYLLDFFVFRDINFLSEHTIFELAFLPIEVIVVSLILDQLLEMRAKQDRIEKLNMVIGVFFSEVGTTSLKEFSKSDPNIDDIRSMLLVGPNWQDEKFKETAKIIKSHTRTIDIKKVDLEKYREFLIGKRKFLIQLLENPVVLEHESFTELLRSMFHLAEELEFRKDLRSLPDSDHAHIKGDMERVYTRLINEWLDYMRYMKNNYPYLYSLSMRTNPFDENASPIVK